MRPAPSKARPMVNRIHERPGGRDRTGQYSLRINDQCARAGVAAPLHAHERMSALAALRPGPVGTWTEPESYLPGKHGIGWRQIVAPRKRFAGHVFGHIYSNARCQYLSTIKEQASFLITGLIIIEMALNIHGYLNYEMLRQMLYRNWEIVVCIVLGIFLLVKATEITVEILVSREAAKYENA